MADDVNKSGKGPQNSIGGEDWSHEENLSAMLEHIERVNRPRGQQYTVAEKSLRESLARLHEMRAAGTPNSVGPWKDEFANVFKQRDVMRNYRTRAQNSAQSQYSTLMSRQYSSSAITGQIGRMQHSTSVQSGGLRASMNSYSSLENEYAETEATLNDLHRRSQSINLFGPGGSISMSGRTTLSSIEAERRTTVQRRAELEAGMRHHRMAGSDPQSQMELAHRMHREAVGINAVQGQSVQLSTGAVSTGADLNRAYMKASQELIKAFEDLKKGVEGAEERVKNFSNDMKVAGDAISRGGGGGRNIAGWQLASAGFQAVGGAIMAIGVNQRIQQQSNIAGFAGIENQKYDMYSRARAGSVQDQMLLGGLDSASMFGQSLKNWTRIGQGAQIAGDIAQVGAGVAKVGASAASTPGGFVGGGWAQTANVASAGAQDIIGGAASAAVNTSDLARGTSAGANAIAGHQARMEALRQLTYVQAKQLQGFRDFSVGAGAVSMQMGRRGESFLNQAISGGNLDAMIKARISPEQFNELAQMGTQNLGSTFSGSEQIFAAQNLNRAGFGTAQQNMQRMATLASAGSNNPQAGLQSVLEAAFSKSLNDSKTLNMLVDNTAVMAQANGAAMAAGINVTGAAATLLTSTMDPNTQNKEFALQRALGVQQGIQNITSNTDVSFTGMVNTARISAKTGLGSTEAIFAAKLSAEQLQTMQKQLDSGDEAAVRKALMDQGVNPNNLKGGIGAGIGSLLESKLYALTEGAGGLAFGDQKQRENIIAYMKNPNGDIKLTDAEKTLMGQIGISAGGLGGSELLRGGASILNAKNTEGAAGQVATAMKGEGAGQNQMKAFEMATSGMKQLAEAAKAGTEAMGGATRAFQALSELTQGIERLNKNGGLERQMQTAAAEAADTFKSSVGLFNTGANIIKDAAVILANKAGMDVKDAQIVKKAEEYNKSQNEKR